MGIFNFNGRLYGASGFSSEDGPTVLYTLYDWEQKLKNSYFWHPYGNHNKDLKDYLMYRDNDRCKYCRRFLTNEEATVDHYFPPEAWHISEVDTCDSLINLVIACEQCNFFKGKHMPFDFYIYDRTNANKLRVFLRFCRRKKTHVKLTLQGTRTLTGKHKGFELLNNMSDQERKQRRNERFKKDYSSG